jgi:putative cardiolipin synthase
VADQVLALLAEARESVVVETPYLIPSGSLRRALRAALERGVRVRLLTNSLSTTDNVLSQAAYAGEKEPLVRAGVELWEYAGPECLHSKIAVADGRRSLVGSFNLDPRSERLNAEVGILVESEALAGQLLGVVEADLSRARRIGPDGKPEGSAERFPDASGCKVARMRILRLFVPIFRGQL